MGYKGTKTFISVADYGLPHTVKTEIEVSHSSMYDLTYINDVAISDSTLQDIFQHCLDWGIVDLPLEDDCRDLRGDSLAFERIQELEKYERAFNTITDESVDEVLKYEE